MIQFAILPILATVSEALAIPALVTSIFALAATVFAWFATWFTKKIAINLTILTLILGLAFAAFLAIETMVLGLSYVAPEGLVKGFGMIVPSNLIPCASTVFSARVVRWVWEWKAYTINIMAS